jgi:hypothetical protein
MVWYRGNNAGAGRHCGGQVTSLWRDMLLTVADFDDVLRCAARLQQLVPDAVLVGGSAAALHAHHRVSFDHDHVLADLRERFDTVLGALEAEPDWVFNRAVPGKLILGQLGGIEVGVRQMIRTTPLETEEISLPGGERIRVPTAGETLRVKAWLIVRRNQVRDYLDVAALSDRLGLDFSAGMLRSIDDYYSGVDAGPDAVASQLVRQLSDPRPADQRAVAQLSNYRQLRTPWTRWDAVVAQCRRVADAM